MILKPKAGNYKELQDPPNRNPQEYEKSWVKASDLPLPEDKKAYILDVGCRAGHLVKELQDLGYYNTYGIEIGDGCVKYWDTHYPDIKEYLIHGDFLSTSIYKKFKLLVLSHVLEHLYDPQLAKEKINELLIYDGKAYITFPIFVDNNPAHNFTFEKELEILDFLKEYNILSFKRIIEDTNPVYEVIIQKNVHCSFDRVYINQNAL